MKTRAHGNSPDRMVPVAIADGKGAIKTSLLKKNSFCSPIQRHVVPRVCGRSHKKAFPYLQRGAVFRHLHEEKKIGPQYQNILCGT